MGPQRGRRGLAWSMFGTRATSRTTRRRCCGSAARGVCESPRYQGPAWVGLAPAKERMARTQLCPRHRNGRDAYASVRPPHHSETAAGPRRRLQPWPGHASTDRDGLAARTPRPPACGRGFARVVDPGPWEPLHGPVMTRSPKPTSQVINTISSRGKACGVQK